MKLRFVKFLTSRGNEIEKKEEEKEVQHYVSCHPPARPRPEPRPAPVSPPAIIPSSLPPPAPLARILRRPSLLAATDRESNILQLSPPQLFRSSPFFFIKLPKQKSVVVVAWRGTQLAGPAVLPNDNMRAPSSPHLALH